MCEWLVLFVPNPLVVANAPRHNEVVARPYHSNDCNAFRARLQTWKCASQIIAHCAGENLRDDRSTGP